MRSWTRKQTWTLWKAFSIPHPCHNITYIKVRCLQRCDGYWRVGSTFGDIKGGLRCSGPSNSPPFKGWEYRDKLGCWLTDPDMVCAPETPRVPWCQSYKIKAKGSHWKGHSDVLGSFVRLNTWSAGRPVKYTDNPNTFKNFLFRSTRTPKTKKYISSWTSPLPVGAYPDPQKHHLAQLSTAGQPPFALAALLLLGLKNGGWVGGNGSIGMRVPLKWGAAHIQRSDIASLLMESSRRLQNNALCSYPHVKVPIRDLCQTLTTAPIFQQSHYFRQHIWVNIWIQFHFLFIFLQYQTISDSELLRTMGENKHVGTSWTVASPKAQ